MNNLFAIFIGGGLGSIARYGTGKFVNLILPAAFPYGTLMANTISSLILGLFIGITSLKFKDDSPARFFIAVGFCGGLSTFSTFSAETFELLKNGMFLLGGINIISNLLVCLTVIGAGIWIGKLI